MELVEQVERFLGHFEWDRAYEEGSSLYKEESAKMVSLDIESGKASLEILEFGSYSYRVVAQGLTGKGTIQMSCSCSQRGIICRHSIAALFELEAQLNAGSLYPSIATNGNASQRGQYPGLIATEPLAVSRLPQFVDMGRHSFWEPQRWMYAMDEIELKDSEVSGWIQLHHKKYNPTLSLSEDETLTCLCNCGPRNKPICVHGYALLLYLASHYENREDVIFMLRDHSTIIEKLLSEYGYTPEDEWQEQFEVLYDANGILLHPKDSGLSKVAEFADWDQVVRTFVKPSIHIREDSLQHSELTYGILWNRSPADSFLFINLITGKRKKSGDLGSPLRMISGDSRSWDTLNSSQRKLGERLKATQLMQELYSWSEWSNQPVNWEEEDGIVRVMAERHKKRLELYPSLLYEEHYYCVEPLDRDVIPSGKTERVYLKAKQPELWFEFREVDDQYVLTPHFRIGEDIWGLNTSEILAYGVLLDRSNLYMLDMQAARALLFFRDKSTYRIRKDDLEQFTATFLLPLIEYFTVEVDGIELEWEEPKGKAAKKIYLKEVEDHLVIMPSLVYHLPSGELREVYLDGSKQIAQLADSRTITLIARDAAREAQIRKDMENLHPQFQDTNDTYYTLPIDQVAVNSWFFEAFSTWQETGYEVLGLKDLENLKYSPFRPTVRLQASSGTDWFDLEMEVSFGSETVKLADIRKAVLNRQHYVKLDNGSMGILPESWLQKYSSLFKVAQVKDGKLSFSEFQISLIDELYSEIDNAEIFEETLEKRRKLKAFKEIKHVDLPVELKADLREYQKSGYNWLNFLDEFGWGGCLADDMGLGKTVQMLAFLLNVSNENPGATHLIVVPRSLVFNWENEVRKFTPKLSVLRHTGSDRIKDLTSFLQYDLILTTYGLVRSDIELFREFNFHYVVLDESQAIKNPLTKTAKAVKLLRTQNRLIMTGTPIENNTFDLYSQMDFVNPGMLGSIEGFRREFANPIDKEKNEATAEQLRKLVYPFILSRKKHEVAKDLPDKIETVLYCEMPASQRQVYNFYKDKYRTLLIEKMATEGYGKAGMYILQGLMKLRQICNSPELIDEPEAQVSSESAKMEVLVSMLEDIIAEGHKVLVFSFFKGMLNLIAKALDEREEGYVLLTGDSNNREALVQEFKEDDEKKVFLISLKAGGFGLNLEEANYVFLVDPWWNPAVEQQAIDRSHRIGQTQNVFAYKLICKDTIEEKILALQERKKALAGDIIHTEGGFLKQLKPEDVTELFS